MYVGPHLNSCPRGPPKYWWQQPSPELCVLKVQTQLIFYPALSVPSWKQSTRSSPPLYRLSRMTAHTLSPRTRQGARRVTVTPFYVRLRNLLPQLSQIYGHSWGSGSDNTHRKWERKFSLSLVHCMHSEIRPFTWLTPSCVFILSSPGLRGSGLPSSPSPHYLYISLPDSLRRRCSRGDWQHRPKQTKQASKSSLWHFCSLSRS